MRINALRLVAVALRVEPFSVLLVWAKQTSCWRPVAVWHAFCGRLKAIEGNGIVPIFQDHGPRRDPVSCPGYHFNCRLYEGPSNDKQGSCPGIGYRAGGKGRRHCGRGSAGARSFTADLFSCRTGSENASCRQVGCLAGVRFFVPGPRIRTRKNQTDYPVVFEKDEATTVLVRFDDQWQIGFEVERIAGGKVVVYLPGAPDPWSGAVTIVTDNRIARLDSKQLATLGVFKQLGEGASAQMKEVV